MLLDVLERLAIPVITVLLGAGGVGSIWLSRRQATPPATSVRPSSAPDPATDQVGATLWIMAEVTEMQAKLRDLQADHDRVLEEVPPYVRWVESGSLPPIKALSERVRTILGLDP